MLHSRQHGFSIFELLVGLVVVAALVMAGIFVWTRTHHPFADGKISAKDAAALPDISYFQTHKSDQFIVDMSLVNTGFPYKGTRALSPHTGAHVQFARDEYQHWPKGGTAPSDYPPIYSPVDGVVSDVQKTFHDPTKGKADLYELDIAFAKDANAYYTLHYSLEPFVVEPSPGFFAKFIDVKVGDHVKKGQVIAHMYLSKDAFDIEHIHFNLSKATSNGNVRLPPAIFTTDIVNAFAAHWGMFGRDAENFQSGQPIPACMGYKLSAAENPFGTGAVDCLN